ncbi:peptidase M28, partial [Empedobacter falsenii]
MKNIIVLLSLIVATKSYAQVIEVKNLKKHIYYFADDKMKGRGTGSDENLKAAKYIAKEFKKYKLQPLGEDGYFQGFDAKVRKVKVVDSIRS